MSELLWHLDVWRSGTFLLYSGKAAFWIQETSPRLSDVERSVVLRSMFVISSTLTYLRFIWECATPPHFQVRHCLWLSFTRLPPCKRQTLGWEGLGTRLLQLCTRLRNNS